MAGVLDAVPAAIISPSEGQDVSSLVKSFRRTLEVTDLEARVAVLEARDASR